MNAKKKYILFLNNEYSEDDLLFYKSKVEGRVAVAVDGGLSFFLKANIRPDILIGDFDSLPDVTDDYLNGIEVIKHPIEKDKTDSQLALELAIEREAGEIDICGATDSGEVDHILGNIFLLDLINKYNNQMHTSIRGRIYEPGKELYLISNKKLLLKGKVGDRISIIPASKKIFAEYDGMKYPAPDRWIKFGETLSLRNELVEDKIMLVIKGKAVVVLIRKGTNSD